MKRFLSFLLILMLLFAVGCSSADTPDPGAEDPSAGIALTPGDYEVSVDGHNGVIHMKVTLEEDRIGNIEILDHTETGLIGDAAFDALLPAIVADQNLEVDAAAGATVTSRAVISGVAEAIRMANGDPDDFMKPGAEDDAPGETIEREADVVVIGSGAAGLAAALEARRAGCSVLLLEKLSHAGGNTCICGGIIYGTGSEIQAANGLTGDSADALAQYWLDRAEGNADPELLQFVAEHSGETIDWLVENGVVFSPTLSAPGTAGVLRGIRTVNGGVDFVVPLLDKVQEEGVEVLLNTRATELIAQDGVVCGVTAVSGKDTLHIAAEAVVLATGGFDADPETARKYCPDLASDLSYSSPGNVGDGIVMAEAVGADTVFKGGVIGYRAVPGIGYRHPINNLRTANCLSVTQEGERYTNETIDYPIFYANMKATGSEMFYSIFDSAVPNETLELAAEGGYALKADTIEELAGAIGVPAETLSATVARYNELCAKGSDDDFGKAAEQMIAIEQGPFYALKVIPATIGSMGGVKINLNAEVLNTEGGTIPGLFAAGATANGDFLYQTYPASGSAIQFAFTTGRVAGQQAAARANG